MLVVCLIRVYISSKVGNKLLTIGNLNSNIRAVLRVLCYNGLFGICNPELSI